MANESRWFANLSYSYIYQESSFDFKLLDPDDEEEAIHSENNSTFTFSFGKIYDQRKGFHFSSYGFSYTYYGKIEFTEKSKWQGSNLEY